jgi:hypothetical protein
MCTVAAAEGSCQATESSVSFLNISKASSNKLLPRRVAKQVHSEHSHFCTCREQSLFMVPSVYLLSVDMHMACGHTYATEYVDDKRFNVALG